VENDAIFSVLLEESHLNRSSSGQEGHETIWQPTGGKQKVNPNKKRVYTRPTAVSPACKVQNSPAKFATSTGPAPKVRIDGAAILIWARLLCSSK
jgi:hypothetical protein